MSQTLTPADVSHYSQRLADLSTLPFWQLPDFTAPTGPERAHVWAWRDVHAELARTREILDEAAVVSQRRALVLRNPGLDGPAATPTIAAAYDTAGTAFGPSMLSPTRDGVGRHSPVRCYPWQQARSALRRLMARGYGDDPVSRLEYRNPVTGGPALATLGCLLEGLPAGAQSRPSRETASSVLVVARGSGTLVCGGQTFELLPHDVAAVPAWTWHQLTAGDHELVLLRVTDRPVHDAFGLYRGETAPA